MKIRKLALGLLSFSSFLPVGSLVADSAFAGCVMADVGIQYNISGSKKPTKRTNDVAFESDAPCMGNTSVTTGIQGNVGGTEPVEQHRRVRHRMSGGGKNYPLQGPTVAIPVEVQIDVYNAAERLKYSSSN